MSDSEDNPFGGPASRRRSISSTGQPKPRTVKLDSTHSESDHSEYADLNQPHVAFSAVEPEPSVHIAPALLTARKSLRPTPAKELLKQLKVPESPKLLSSSSKGLPTPKTMPYPVRLVYQVPDKDLQADARAASFFARQRNTGWTQRASEVHEAWRDPAAFEEVLEAARLLSAMTEVEESSVFKVELHERTRRVTKERLEMMASTVQGLIDQLKGHLGVLEGFRREIRRGVEDLE